VSGKVNLDGQMVFHIYFFSLIVRMMSLTGLVGELVDQTTVENLERKESNIFS
jgi:hypothetical protein